MDQDGQAPEAIITQASSLRPGFVSTRVEIKGTKEEFHRAVLEIQFEEDLRVPWHNPDAVGGDPLPSFAVSGNDGTEKIAQTLRQAGFTIA